VAHTVSASHDDTGCIGIPGQLRRFLQEGSRWSQRPFLRRTGRQGFQCSRAPTGARTETLITRELELSRGTMPRTADSSISSIRRAKAAGKRRWVIRGAEGRAQAPGSSLWRDGFGGRRHSCAAICYCSARMRRSIEARFSDFALPARRSSARQGRLVFARHLPGHCCQGCE
jgi:hypothetical protein